jgi:hypothetical protein
MRGAIGVSRNGGVNDAAFGAGFEEHAGRQATTAASKRADIELIVMSAL